MSVSDRAKSAFPVSIGTSLALESLYPGRSEPYDPKREVTQVDLSPYTEIYINLGTLFRNLVGAMKSHEYETISNSELINTLVSELEIIDSVFKTEGAGKIRPVFYYPDYSAINARIKHIPNNIVKLRVPETLNQINYHNKLTEVFDKGRKDLSRYVDFYTDADIRVPKGEDEVKTKAIMLSHHVWDLLTYEKFNTLDLLESHTGVLKKKAMWYTKYFGGADNPPMPFHRKLYYIFGDKDTLKPVNVNLRKTIKELAEKKKWSGVTTIDKVMFDLENELRDPFVMSVFRIL